MLHPRWLSYAALFTSFIASTALPCGRPPNVRIDSVSPHGVVRPGDEIVVYGDGFDKLSSAARLTFTSRTGSGFGHGRVVYSVASSTELTAWVPSDAISGEVRITEVVRCPGLVANSYSAVQYTLGQGPFVDIDNLLPHEPFGREAVVVSDTGIDAQWQAGNPADRSGFVVNVSDDGGLSYQRATTVFDPRGERAELRGLKSGTTYVIDVAAFGPGGETFTQTEDLLIETTAGVQGGSGEVIFRGAPGIFCRAKVQPSRVEAVFDQDHNGVVLGATGDPRRGSYPHFMEYETPSTVGQIPVRHIRNSASFGRNIAGHIEGNLSITGYIEGCGWSRPQFVALHLAVDSQGARAVAMHVGDRYSSIPGPDGLRGVILDVYDFQGAADLNALLSSTPRAIGAASGHLTYTNPYESYTAQVEFNFDAPVEHR